MAKNVGANDTCQLLSRLAKRQTTPDVPSLDLTPSELMRIELSRSCLRSGYSDRMASWNGAIDSACDRAKIAGKRICAMTLTSGLLTNGTSDGVSDGKGVATLHMLLHINRL